MKDTGKDLHLNKKWEIVDYSSGDYGPCFVEDTEKGSLGGSHFSFHGGGFTLFKEKL